MREGGESRATHHSLRSPWARSRGECLLDATRLSGRDRAQRPFPGGLGGISSILQAGGIIIA